MRRRAALVLLAVGLSARPSAAVDAELRRKAASTLRRSCEFFREKVACEGGCLWRYSEDLRKREGESKASAKTVWVQPPGTPTVGLAFLEAWRATGDRYYLEGAKAAAHCLVRGQLRSGGWDYRIEFDPAKRKGYNYRVGPPPAGGRVRNTTTLDDNNTQEALRLLMQVDEALAFKDEKLHEAAGYALTNLMKAQYPNGAWPQRYDAFPDPAQFPVKKASCPESWSREWTRPKYKGYYTFNDNLMRDMIDVFFAAARVYESKPCRDAAARAGGFILLAQMPEPQPAWAQQYDAAMHPAWARRFEPPAVTGGESQGVLRTLLRLYRDTGERKYLEPVPRAIAYLRRSRLKNGRLARFYELRTNKPLFFTKKYVLTYSDSDTPTHYAFEVGFGVEKIEREYKALARMSPEELERSRSAVAQPKLSGRTVSRVKAAVASLDGEGRWVEDGRLKYHGSDDPTRRVIDCRTFVRNVRALSEYLAATR